MIFWMVTNDPETLWDIMIGIIISVADTMYPIERLNVPDTKPDWMNDYLVKYLNKKQAAYVKATKTGKPEDWDLFKKLRSTTKRLIRKHKTTLILLIRKWEIEGMIQRNSGERWGEICDSVNILRKRVYSKLLMRRVKC